LHLRITERFNLPRIVMGEDRFEIACHCMAAQVSRNVADTQWSIGIISEPPPQGSGSFKRLTPAPMFREHRGRVRVGIVIQAKKESPSGPGKGRVVFEWPAKNSPPLHPPGKF